MSAKKLAKRASKRQDLIDATLVILAAHGMAGISAALIAKQAGVSKANLFHHFGSIDELLFASFEQYIMTLPGFDPVPGMALVQWLGEAGAQFLSCDVEASNLFRVYFTFAVNALGDERMRARLLEIVAVSRSNLAQVFAAMDGLNMTPNERLILADLIIATLDGFAVHLQLGPERAPALREAWALFVRTLTDKLEMKI